MSFERVVMVTHLERLNNSVNANPRYRVHTSEGSYITSSDESFVYGIENGWTSLHRWVGGRRAWITLTRAGRISDLTWKD